MWHYVHRALLACVWVWVCVAMFPDTTRGQTAPIRIHTLTLRGATPTSFTATKDLRIDVDPASLSSVRSFQVRVFRGTKSELPHLGRLMPDGCLEYDTSVYDPIYRRGQIFVAQTNRSWLSAPDGRHYTNGQFVLIFEVGGPRDTRIRISGPDLENYFSRGLEVEVVPDAYLPERVAQEVEEHNRRYHDVVSRVTTNIRGCLEVLEARGPVLLMNFASCSRRLEASEITSWGASLDARMAAMWPPRSSTMAP